MSISNHPSLAEVRAQVKQLGKDQANGKESQIRFALVIVENSHYGLFDLQPNKHGPGKDDANLLMDDWIEGKEECQFHDRTSGSGKKTLSNIKKMVRLGGCPKWGRSTYDNVNTLLAMRLEEQKNKKKVKGAHDCLLEYATAQLGSDHLIVGDELREFVFTNEKEPDTEETVLESARKTLNRLSKGRVPASASSKAAAEAAINVITQGLADLARARN
jgi:hypothetical protein